jgi:hypothetical protein
MTPAIQKWAKWFEENAGDAYDEMPHWFDFSDCVNNPAIVYPIDWLPHYRPPFHDTAAVCNYVHNGIRKESLLLLSGSDPEEGIGFALACSIGGGKVKKYAPGWYALRNGELHINPECADDKFSMHSADISMALTAIFYRTLAESRKTAYLPIVEKPFTDQRNVEKNRPLKYTWHTLVVGAEAILREDRGGVHASPRQHDRRGHQRRLRSGKVVWVKPCKVGSAAQGAVFKDYAVRTLQ